MSEVRQEEWDALITTAPLGGVKNHICVIGFGCHSASPKAAFGFGYYEGTKSYATETSNPGHVDWKGESVSQEFIIPEGLPPAVENVVLTGLLPLVRKQSSHKWLYPIGRLDESDLRSWEEKFQAFLRTGDGQAIAGRFVRKGGNAECWCFPEYVLELAPILVEAALGEWAKRDPAKFPSKDWMNQSQWRTPTENRIAYEIDLLESERRAILARLGEREQELQAELVKAKQSAATRERLLLTAQGHELVRAVTHCLTELGFEVKDMDDMRGSGERLEDLRITVPGQEWTALVEVKGNTGGAKANELMKFGRSYLQFFQEYDREPDAGWYIVNQFLGTDPSTRQIILSGNDASLASFVAHYRGLAIDTKDLFRLWMAFGDGNVTAEDARSRLMQARGRFAFEARGGDLLPQDAVGQAEQTT